MTRMIALVVAAMAALSLQMPALAQVAPFGQPADRYVLTFREEFDGSTLNTSRWNDHIWYEPSNPTLNYAVENGSLRIWPQRDATGQFFNRTIDSDGRFSQRYGYFEIEARLPVGKGVWPAFWLFNHIQTRRPEIDVMEAYPGGGPESGWSDANLHPTAYGMAIWRDATVLAGSKAMATADLSAAYHRYAVRWESNRITFYFDGAAAYTRNVQMRDPMYLILSLWFGSASGTPDDTTPTGKTNSYEINYVRAWRFR